MPVIAATGTPSSHPTRRWSRSQLIAPASWGRLPPRAGGCALMRSTATVPRAISVQAPLTAKTSPGPATVSSAPAAAGPASADEPHVLLDKTIALNSMSAGTTRGTRAVWAGMLTASRAASHAAAR
ncbi:MAG TPA: hypothetical protein VGM53_11435 [Streptosporangiaceae bacterium]|jgi:hypothetical protein